MHERLTVAPAPAPSDLTTIIVDLGTGELRTEPGWAGILGAWLAEVQGRTGSDATTLQYGRYVARFAERLAAVGRTLATATPADVHAFAYAALPDARRGGDPGKAPGPSGVAVRLAAVRSLYDFARRIGAVDRNPADDIKRPRLPEPIPKGLTTTQVHDLLAAPLDSAAGRRDRAIILTAILTGLRRAELLGLTAGAIGLDDGTPMYTARTKGGKLRYRELPQPAWDAITTYLDGDGRPLDTLDDDDRLFPITETAFYLNLRRYGETAGIPDLTIHTLRHTAAKFRRQSGATLEDVQAALGHSNVATTARYLARLEGSKDTGWQGVADLLGIASTADDTPTRAPMPRPGRRDTP